MIMIMADTYTNAKQMAETANIPRFEWIYLDRPEQLVGWERPRIVQQNNMAPMTAQRAALLADAEARSAVFYTEFDLEQGRVR